MSSIRNLLDAARQRLCSRLEADVLLAHVLGQGRAWLYAHNDALPGTDQIAEFRALVERRERGEPVAYLTGRREFFGCDFLVSSAVLIPRPETELVVELALAKLPEADCRLLDVGTGSGCIGLSLARLRPGWQISLSDRCAEALAVCRANAQQLGLDRVRILEGDLLAPVAGEQFEVIVSNPPYVAAGDPHLDQGDLRFEPDSALSAGAGGLDVIKRLIDQAGDHLVAGGWLMLEHGHDQAAAVAECLQTNAFTGIESHCDLAGIERVTLGRSPQIT